MCELCVFPVEPSLILLTIQTPRDISKVKLPTGKEHQTLSMQGSIRWFSRMKADEVSVHFANILYGTRQRLCSQNYKPFWQSEVWIEKLSSPCPFFWPGQSCHHHYYRGVRWIVPHEIKRFILNNNDRQVEKKHRIKYNRRIQFNVKS